MKKSTANEIQITLQHLEHYKGVAADNYSKQKENLQFVYGDQYKESVKKALEASGHAPIAFNYIISTVQQGIAMVTANNPGYYVIGRDDEETNKGKMFADFLAYLWYHSRGNGQLKRALKSYYIQGVGHLHVYKDINDDYGRGELKFKYEPNWGVFVDPSSKDPLYDDAKDIILVNVITKEVFENNFPQYKKVLKKAVTTDESLIPESEIGEDNLVFDAESLPDEEKYRLIIRYKKIRVPYIHFVNGLTGKEEVFSKEDWDNEISKKEMFMIQVFGEDGQPEGEAEYFEEEEEWQFTVEQMKANDIFFEYRTITYEELVEREIFYVFDYLEQRIKMMTLLEEELLFEEILPIQHYPVIPIFNIHNDTPYPLSDVSIAYPIQEFINKMISLVIAHTQASTTLKLLIPDGSVEDIREVEKNWMKPWATIPFDSSYGKPEVATVPPLNNAVFNLIQMAKHLIEYQFGLFESQMGNATRAPQTYKGTLAIDDFGQRRIRSKLQDIEESLTRLGQVLIDWAQDFYTDAKIFRIIQADQTSKEGQINGLVYDDFGNIIDKFNDISTGRYDVVVHAGSTLPINKYAEWEIYKEAYREGLIDQVEALKKSQIFDKEGVLNRMGAIQQLTAQIEQATEKINKLEGDLQTADREAIHAKKTVEVEKFKAKLEKIINDLEASAEIQEAGVEAEVKSILNELKTMTKEVKEEEITESRMTVKDKINDKK